MTDNLSALDFDAFTPVPVKLGGRSFMIRPQSAAMIQRVLEYSSVDTDRPIRTEGEDTGQGKDPRAFVRDAFSTWADTVAATAHMLGLQPGTPEYDDGYAHLTEHLRPGAVMKIYETWWRVNEIDDFFERGGRALMPLDYLERLRKVRTEMAGQLMDLAMQAATEETSVA